MMKDMMVGFAVMAVYAPLITVWIMKGDEWIDKAGDAIESFLWPVKSEPKEHADLLVMFGEAVDA